MFSFWNRIFPCQLYCSLQDIKKYNFTLPNVWFPIPRKESQGRISCSVRFTSVTVFHHSHMLEAPWLVDRCFHSFCISVGQGLQTQMPIVASQAMWVSEASRAGEPCGTESGSVCRSHSLELWKEAPWCPSVCLFFKRSSKFRCFKRWKRLIFKCHLKF